MEKETIIKLEVLCSEIRSEFKKLRSEISETFIGMRLEISNIRAELYAMNARIRIHGEITALSSPFRMEISPPCNHDSLNPTYSVLTDRDYGLN